MKPTIYTLLSASTQQDFGKNIAIAAPHRSALSYNGLLRHSQWVATQLNHIGLKQGDRVAVALPNGPEMAVTFLTITSCVTCAPLNPNYREREFDFYLSDLDAKALIVQPGIAGPARDVARTKGIPIIELCPQLGKEAGLFTFEGIDAAPTDSTLSVLPKDEDVALILHTSGTTSRPKMVPLTHRNLCTSAHNIANALALTKGDRCLNVMPLFHIHGLIGVLLSSISVGGSVTCTPGFQTAHFFDWVHEFSPTWYSAVPTMHQAILARAEMHQSIIQKSPIRLIRSSSASLPPKVMSTLENIFNAPVIESYGMTEASHQMASNPLPPKVRKPGSVGIAAGPKVAIMDEAGTLLPTGQVGEIVIRGVNVTQGYINNPNANANAFTDGWFRTGDQGLLDEDGYLFIKGRIKELINRGGEKIAPREIDEILLEHPAIAQSLAFSMPHPQLGEDVAAAVVLREGENATESDIQAFAAEFLADFKIPRKIVFLDEIPKGPTGKLQRIGLAEKLGITALASDSKDFVAPQNNVELNLTKIWEDVLGIQPIGTQDNFFELGGTSLQAAHLFTQIEQSFGKTLPLATLFQAATIEQLAQIIRQHDGSAPWSSLVTIQAGGSKPPLFCIHGGGFNLLIYNDLAKSLGPEYPVYGLQAQGLDGTAVIHGSFQEMAADYIKHIQTVQPEGPYLLAGISLGGTIALEMAQQLQAQGQHVSLLAMFDTHGPDNYFKVLPAPTRLLSVLNYAVRYTIPRFTAKRLHGGVEALVTGTLQEVQKANQWVGNDQTAHVTPKPLKADAMMGNQSTSASEHQSAFEQWVHNLNMWIIERSQLSYLAPQAAVHGLGGTLADAVQTLEAIHLEARLKYTPQPYTGRITLFRANEQPPGFYRDPHFGWGSIASNGLDIYDMPGYHADIVKSSILAEKMRECIDKTSERMNHCS